MCRAHGIGSETNLRGLRHLRSTPTGGFPNKLHHRRERHKGQVTRQLDKRQAIQYDLYCIRGLPQVDVLPSA